MHGSLASNAGLLGAVREGAVGIKPELAVCVPAPYLAQVQSVLTASAVAWGAQDVSAHEGGAFTGEVAASMLTDFGCRYVIIGHSERRSYHAETDQQVAQKTARALAAGLTPIVCVGETLVQREQGMTAVVVTQQLGPVLDAAGVQIANIIIAYEPVWAIGTGKTATPEMAQVVHQQIRALLSERDSSGAAQARILYGGSMRPENAKALLGMPDIDGGLVGGAALKAADFLAIASAA